MVNFQQRLSDANEYAIVFWGQSNSRPWGDRDLEGYKQAIHLGRTSYEGRDFTITSAIHGGIPGKAGSTSILFTAESTAGFFATGSELRLYRTENQQASPPCSKTIFCSHGAQLEPPTGTNTATGGTASTLVDAGVAGWSDNEWQNKFVRIIGGVGAGQTRLISSNTTDTLTVTPNWTTNPDFTSLYMINEPGALATMVPGPPNILRIEQVVGGVDFTRYLTTGQQVVVQGWTIAGSATDINQRYVVTSVVAETGGVGSRVTLNPCRTPIVSVEASADPDSSVRMQTTVCVGRGTVTLATVSPPALQVTWNTDYDVNATACFAHWGDRWKTYENIKVLTPFQPEEPGDYPVGTPTVPGYTIQAGVDSYSKLGLFLDFTWNEGNEGVGSSGLVTGSAPTTLTDSAANFPLLDIPGSPAILAGLYDGGYVLVENATTGTPIAWGQVVSHTANQLTVDSWRGSTPSNGNRYTVFAPHWRSSPYVATPGKGFRQVGNDPQPTPFSQTGWIYNRPRDRRVPGYIGQRREDAICDVTLNSQGIARSKTAGFAVTKRWVAQQDSGTATAGGASTLTDSGKTWATNLWNGAVLNIVSGVGAGQSRTVASNTGTVLTVSVPWAIQPDTTSTYEVGLGTLRLRISRTDASPSNPATEQLQLDSFLRWKDIVQLTNWDKGAYRSGTSTGSNSPTTFNDTGATWNANEHIGRVIRIVAGTGSTAGPNGSNETAVVISNTATQLTVTTWSVVPDASSQYVIETAFDINGLWSVESVEPVGAGTGSYLDLAPAGGQTLLAGGSGYNYTQVNFAADSDTTVTRTQSIQHFRFGAMVETAWRMSTLIGRPVRVIHLSVNSASQHLRYFPNPAGFQGVIGWWDFNKMLDWTPGNPDGAATRLQSMIQDMAVNALRAEGNNKPLKVIGIFGFQGEGDALTPVGRETYATTLRTFYDWLRRQLSAAGIAAAGTVPIVHARITQIPWQLPVNTPVGEGGPGGGDVNGAINAAIEALAADTSYHFRTFNTDTHPKLDGTTPFGADNLHFNGRGEAMNGAVAIAKWVEVAESAIQPQ